MKKLFSLFIALSLFLMIASPVLAIGNAFGQGNAGSRAAEREQKTKERMDNISENLKQRAQSEIGRRVESLNKLLTRINEFKKLSATQKSTLTTQVQSEISTLNALLAKINADTDVATLRTDVKSIVDAYRIYALFIPQIQILGAADRILTVTDEMTTLAAKLETKINEQQTKGQNVTDLQTLLTDMKAKIADAKTQSQAAIDAVTPLTPAGFPGNKTTLQSARQMLATALKDLNTARQDVRQIMVGLTKLNKTKITPIVTTAPTP